MNQNKLNLALNNFTELQIKPKQNKPIYHDKPTEVFSYQNMA